MGDRGTAPTAGDGLHTARLHLRWLTDADAGFMLGIWNDPAFVRHVGDRGLRTIDDAKQALEQGILATYREFGYGPFLVCLAGTGEPVGICGLFRRAGIADPDIGYALLPAYTGAGYAFEAATAVLEHARHGIGLSRVIAIVSPENRPSVALLEKLGLRYESMMRLDGETQDVCRYAIEWPAAG